jgi:hypothetical protein
MVLERDRRGRRVGRLTPGEAYEFRMAGRRAGERFVYGLLTLAVFAVVGWLVSLVWTH